MKERRHICPLCGERIRMDRYTFEDITYFAHCDKCAWSFEHVSDNIEPFYEKLDWFLSQFPAAMRLKEGDKVIFSQLNSLRDEYGEMILVPINVEGEVLSIERVGWNFYLKVKYFNELEERVERIRHVDIEEYPFLVEEPK